MQILREQDKDPRSKQCTYILEDSCEYTLVVLTTASAHQLYLVLLITNQSTDLGKAPMFPKIYY